MNDELPDASLFRVEIVPKWSEQVVHFLTTRTLKDVEDSLEEKTKFIEGGKRF